MRKVTLLLAFICFALFISSAQEMIADINPGSESSIVTAYTPVIVLDDVLLFTADDGEHGNEIWVFDGNDVQLLKDIRIGSKGIDIEEFVLFNKQVFFVADDGIHGDEWWVTDGSESGTVLFMDLLSGPESGVTTSSYHKQTIVYQNELYFVGASLENDYEPWKTDGTPSGTVLIKNIGYDGSSFNSGSHPEFFLELNGELLFTSRDGLFKTDGTTAGTVLVREDDPYDVFGFDPSNLISMGDYALMYTYERLWRSDGTLAGTIPLDSFGHTSTEGRNERIVRFGDLAFFPAVDPDTGEEMWATDGTSNGAYLIKDIYPGNDGYSRGTITMFQGVPHFKAEDPEYGIELWKSDGTEAGTERVTDIAQGDASSFFWPTSIYSDNELIYMGAGRAFGTELWISDGTTAGTFEIDLNPNGESRPNSMIRFKNYLFFGARSDNDAGYEPHILDLSTYLNRNERDNNQLSLIVSPNPASDELIIEPMNAIEFNIVIYSIDGKCMLRQANSPKNVDVSTFPEGQYFLHVLDAESDQRGVKKFSILR